MNNNYAVIVGIDHYSNPSWQLNAAVGDALRFSSWAIGWGGVKPANIKLLLSPEIAISDVEVPNIAVKLPVLPATSECLTFLLYDEFQDAHWAEDGDRLYFYYAGHGCSHPGVRGKDQLDPVLIFSDVLKLPRDYKKLFTFSDILTKLRGCGPKEQFFFLDACRNFGLDEIVASGGPGGGRFIRPIDLPMGTLAAKQFVLYATSPGGRALETRGKGVFGGALVQGLRGDPRAAQRIAGAPNYELRFTDLFQFVQEEVQRTVANIPSATLSIQIPEHDSEPSVADPLVVSFSEAEIEAVELTVRVAPGSALRNAMLTVFFEGFVKAGPFGPPLNAAHPVLLKPAYYSIEAVATAFAKARTDPFRIPAERPLDLVLSPEPPAAQALPGSSTTQSGSPFLTFQMNDELTVIAVVGPDGFRAILPGSVPVLRPKPGVYQVRIMTPEGVVDEQMFEYPYRSGLVQLKPPAHHIGPEQLSMLRDAGIEPSPDGYLQPSEKLGEIAGLAPASLLGFAAYATYMMSDDWGSPLRSFGLQEIAAEGKDKAWVSLLLSVEAGRENMDAFFANSSLVLYSDSSTLGELSTLPGYPAAAQYLACVTEGNLTLELRLPHVSPIRFPLTCFKERVATLCINVASSGQMEMQVYLIPFRSDLMSTENIRTVEQAQRFYSSSELMPPAMTERLMQMKQLDPLLGCLAGYTLVKEGRSERFRGTPDATLPPDAWNNESPMQNMLTHFALLPDSHVLAALCEPALREQHLATAAKLGAPLFSEGFRVLIDFYRELPGQLKGVLQHARRTLLTGSSFTAWFGYEPALVIENGRFENPPLPWSALTDFRDRIHREARAVGAIHIQDGAGSTFRTAFLIAPDLILTANHAVRPVLEIVLPPGSETPVIRPDAKLSFVLSDSVEQAGVVLDIDSLVAIDSVARLALLRLARKVEDVEPLRIADTETEVTPDQAVYLIGYPFLQNDLDPALVAHVFGSNLGTKRIQPGYVISAPASKPGFDHDAFTLGGSAGSPVIDLKSGLVLGLHWGGMNQFNARRGRAVALWKSVNRAVLPVS